MKNYSDPKRYLGPVVVPVEVLYGVYMDGVGKLDKYIY